MKPGDHYITNDPWLGLNIGLSTNLVIGLDAVAEATVSRMLRWQKLSFLAVLACFLVWSVSVRAQDAPQDAQQPSVADAARQARKDKDKDKDKAKDKDAATSKTVITDENLSADTSVSAGASAGSGSASSKLSAVAPSAAGSPGRSSSFEEAYARLEATEASLDHLEPMGRAELAQTVLHGNTADFPNRSDWEDQLYAAKGVYVQRSRQLIAAMKQVFADMDALQSGGQGKVADNDPRVQALTRKTQQIMELAGRTEAAFQAVVSQGQNLVQQAPPR